MSIDLDRNERAFETLFEANQKATLAFFIGHGLAREDAKDLVQETFSKVWLRICELQDLSPERQRRWIFKVTANLLADFFRRRQNRSQNAGVSIREEELLASEDVHERVFQSDRSSAMTRAIESLPAQRRLILSLSVLGEMSSEEIGIQLGRPAGTIRYELNRARICLKKMMREWTEVK